MNSLRILLIASLCASAVNSQAMLSRVANAGSTLTARAVLGRTASNVVVPTRSFSMSSGIYESEIERADKAFNRTFIYCFMGIAGITCFGTYKMSTNPHNIITREEFKIGESQLGIIKAKEQLAKDIIATEKCVTDNANRTANQKKYCDWNLQKLLNKIADLERSIAASKKNKANAMATLQKQANADLAQTQKALEASKKKLEEKQA